MNILKKSKNRAKKIGQPPGALIHLGEPTKEKITICLFSYNESNCTDVCVLSLEEAVPYLKNEDTSWINIDGIHDIKHIEKAGELFSIHPLILEDILDTEHRPKVEEEENYIFFTLKMLKYNEAKKEIDYEQVSLVLGNTYVISFQEKVGDVFDPIRERIRKGKGAVRQRKADYLMYLLLDAVIDHYYVITDKLAEEIDTLEDDLLYNKKTDESVQKIQKLKRDLIFLRKSVLPLRESISAIRKSGSKLFDPKTFDYLDDLNDHTIHIVELLETYRDIVFSLMDVYLSNLSTKMNSVMKTLTIIATIFIPLTFLAGVYGMNFKHMPELDTAWGYPTVLSIMGITAIIMIFFFRRKKWL